MNAGRCMSALTSTDRTMPVSVMNQNWYLFPAGAGGSPWTMTHQRCETASWKISRPP